MSHRFPKNLPLCLFFFFGKNAVPYFIKKRISGVEQNDADPDHLSLCGEGDPGAVWLVVQFFCNIIDQSGGGCVDGAAMIEHAVNRAAGHPASSAISRMVAIVTSFYSFYCHEPYLRCLLVLCSSFLHMKWRFCLCF